MEKRKEEIIRSAYYCMYNHERPHHGLWNFIPAYMHGIKNNTALFEWLARLKQNTRLERKHYWEQKRLADQDTKDDLQYCAMLSK